MRLKTLFLVALLLLIGATTPILAQGGGKLNYQQIARLHMSPPALTAVWKPDGTQLAVVSFPSILMWDVATQRLTTLVADAQVSGVAWSPDGSRLASVAGGVVKTLRIWDANTGVLLRQISRQEPIGGGTYRLSWSPDGKKIASDNGAASAILVWNIVDEEVDELKGHGPGRVGETDWSQDSSQIASGGADGTIRIWNIATGRNVVTIENADFLVDWNPIDERIAGSSIGNEGRIWDSQTGRELSSVEHGASVLSVKWNFDGTMIATGGLDGVVKVWNAQSGELLTTIKEHSDFIMALAWHPKRNWLVSTSYDGDLRIWQFDQLK